jgi:hypothetical protein
LWISGIDCGSERNPAGWAGGVEIMRGVVRLDWGTTRQKFFPFPNRAMSPPLIVPLVGS